MKIMHPPKGRRELNKEDKLRRIKAAAIYLFTKQGYDETTTREIATRARVALGTIFVYAETKRDLLFLIVNDDLESCIEEARRSLESGDRSVLESLLFVLRVHYEYFAKAPVISRAALREMYFYLSGKQAERFHQTRDRLAKLLHDLIVQAMADKLIYSQESATCVADTLFAIYQVHLRRWLAAEKLEIADAMISLRRQIRVVMLGLAPRPEAISEQHTSKK